MTERYLCDPAKLEWHGEVPYSTEYQDIYWHRGGGAKEKQQIFIEPMMQLAGHIRPGEQFTVCELGFGFGLNCMLAAEQWRSKNANCRLNLISIENQPVKPSVLKKYLQLYSFKHASIISRWKSFHNNFNIWTNLIFGKKMGNSLLYGRNWSNNKWHGKIDE